MCKCAERMREHVLPEAGYVWDGDGWVGPNGDRIPDQEVEEHHTLLMLQRAELRRAAGRAAARKLMDRLKGERT